MNREVDENFHELTVPTSAQENHYWGRVAYRQSQRIAELEAANADLRNWIDATGQGAMLKRIAELEQSNEQLREQNDSLDKKCAYLGADVARQKERIFASWARQKELEAALDGALEALEMINKKNTDREFLQRHEWNQLASALAKIEKVQK